MTGTHETFTEEQIREWLASRADAHDRADWAIVRRRMARMSVRSC